MKLFGKSDERTAIIGVLALNDPEHCIRDPHKALGGSRVLPLTQKKENHTQERTKIPLNRIIPKVTN